MYKSFVIFYSEVREWLLEISLTVVRFVVVVIFLVMEKAMVAVVGCPYGNINDVGDWIVAAATVVKILLRVTMICVVAALMTMAVQD